MQTRTCPICKKTYQADPKRLKHGRQTTCSRKCSYKFRAQQLKKSKSYTCVICGTVFERPPSTAKKANAGLPLCSKECHYKARTQGLSPRPICGPYQPPPPTPTPVLTNGFGHWLAGFIAGEGCFRIHKVRKGAYFGCAFSLKLRDDDTPILTEIVNKLQLGRLKPDRSRNGNSKPCMVWIVDTKADCPTLVSIIDQYPIRAKKANDFRIWKKAVHLWTSFKPGKSVWVRMGQMKKEIEDVRTYKPPT